MTTAEIYAIAPDEHGWRVINGNEVTLGHWVTLGDGVTLGHGVKYSTTPAQIQCHPYIVYPHSPGRIGVGCVVHDIEYWRAGEPAELAEHPECQPWSQYVAAIEYVAAWLTALDEAK